jgi:putative thioredoxin
MEQIIAGAPSAPIDVDINNFMAEVIEDSSKIPVIVQFWAPWCGPCKQLGPILDKIVATKAGKVKLTRVNIDDNQEIAQQMRVQSVPMVYGFVDGQPVDGFTGAQPESTVTEFVDKLAAKGGAGANTAEILEAAETAMAAQDFAAAMMNFQQVMELEPESVEALAGVVRCLTGTGEVADAREVIDELSTEYKEHAAMKLAISGLELAEKAAGSADDLVAAQAAVDANGEDLDARQKLAMALYATGQHADAMEQLLASIRIDRSWNDEAARHQLLEFFTSLGAANPDVMKARRQLSAALFS